MVIRMKTMFIEYKFLFFIFIIIVPAVIAYYFTEKKFSKVNRNIKPFSTLIFFFVLIAFVLIVCLSLLNDQFFSLQNDFLGFYIVSSFSDIVTLYICLLISLITGTNISYSVNLKHVSSLMAYMPVLTATMGVLGTFIGIYMGLHSFDVNNISVSVPGLLERMKTAFLTSIVGMIGAISQKYYLKQINSNDKEDVTKDPYYMLFNDMKSSLDKTSNDILSVTKDFGNATSKSITSELKKLIDQFNATLSESASLAFKILESSVNQLVTWQENYKTYLESMREEVNNLLDVFEASNGSLQQAVNNFEITNAEYKNISDSIKQYSEDIAKMDSNIDKVVEKGASIEQVSNNVEQKTNELNSALSTLSEISESAKNALPSLQSRSSEILDNMSSLSGNINDSVKGITGDLKEYNLQISNNMKQTLEKFNVELLRNTEAFNKDLTNSLNASLNSFGKTMAQLSAQFTKDYSPITEQLAKIVNIANEVQSKQRIGDDSVSEK